MKRGDDGGEFEASKLYIILIGELISDLTMSAATSRATRRATRRATTSATTRAEGRDARLNESPSRRPGDVNKSGDGGGVLVASTVPTALMTTLPSNRPPSLVISPWPSPNSLARFLPPTPFAG